ncbi:MAG: DUF6324 family protein [Pseudomonadota bacterium]
MGIDKESDVSANLQIGPTTEGMVRIYVEADNGVELPLDFDPDEAEEIAAELQAAAEAARQMGGRAGGGHRGGPGGGSPGGGVRPRGRKP